MAVVLLPNTELVVISYLQTMPGVTADVIATQPPQDESQWKQNGCITVSVVGGHPDADLPTRNPIVQLDFFAVNPGSDKPPWYKAASLGEQVWLATRMRERVPRNVTVSAGGVLYPPARVLTAYFLDEPRRIWKDAGDWAHFMGLLAMTWTPLNPIPDPA